MYIMRGNETKVADRTFITPTKKLARKGETIYATFHVSREADWLTQFPPARVN